MNRVRVNDQPHDCAPGTSVAQLLADLGYQCERVAVAIDGEFLPRSDYAMRLLQGAECLDVVAPVQGG